MAGSQLNYVHILIGRADNACGAGKVKQARSYADEIGKVKGPILRGLAARAPHFHNGSTAKLGDAVEFYDRRFDIGFTEEQKADLVAFLNSL